jgi:hypothetical protein
MQRRNITLPPLVAMCQSTSIAPGQSCNLPLKVPSAKDLFAIARGQRKQQKESDLTPSCGENTANRLIAGGSNQVAQNEENNVGPEREYYRDT